MDMPPTHLTDYVVKCRQAGMSDSKISDSLVKANWPLDIVENALVQANAILPTVPEATEQVQQPANEAVKDEKNVAKEANIKSEPQPKNQSSQNLEAKPEKKKFSTFALISLFLSPIPFLGLALCMTAYDYTTKKKMSGAILPILGMIINVALLVFVLYVIYTILTLSPDQLTGFAKVVNDQFKLV